MRLKGWATISSCILCLLCALLGGGCACVDTCYTSSCDFAGCGCTQGCGAQSQPVVDSLCDISQDVRSYCAHGCACRGPRVGSRLGCAHWGKREVFIDNSGAPCYGPIASVAMLLRDSLKNCGCGELYVDEWISDPPVCNDPCGTGCTACRECGPTYAGNRGGCGLLSGGILGGCTGSGCASGGCTDTSCSDGGCSAGETLGEVVEPTCGCSASYSDDSCTGSAVCTNTPSCGCESTGGCLLEPDCGIQSLGGAGGGPLRNAAANVACGCSGGCGKIGCGRVAKGVLAGTATAVGCKVEHFLADRKYKWSERGRARTCEGGACAKAKYTQDIPDYRFDTPGAQPSDSAPSCHCANCAAKSRAQARTQSRVQSQNEAQRVAQLQRVNNNIRTVQHLSEQ